MPAGVSWGKYLTFSTAALFTMFAGAQTVHVFYRPLDDLEKYVQKEKENLQQAISRSNVAK